MTMMVNSHDSTSRGFSHSFFIDLPFDQHFSMGILTSKQKSIRFPAILLIEIWHSEGSKIKFPIQRLGASILTLQLKQVYSYRSIKDNQ